MNHAMCGAPEAATHPQRAPARPSAFCSWPTNRSLLSHFLFWSCAWSHPGLWRRHAILCLQDVGDAVDRAHRCCPCPALAYKAWQDGDYFIFIKLMHNSVSGTLQTDEAAGVVPLTLSRFLCMTPTASTSPPNSTTMKNFRNTAVGAITELAQKLLALLAGGLSGWWITRCIERPLGDAVPARSPSPRVGGAASPPPRRQPRPHASPVRRAATTGKPSETSLTWRPASGVNTERPDRGFMHHGCSHSHACG